MSLDTQELAQSFDKEGDFVPDQHEEVRQPEETQIEQETEANIEIEKNQDQMESTVPSENQPEEKPEELSDITDLIYDKQIALITLLRSFADNKQEIIQNVRSQIEALEALPQE